MKNSHRRQHILQRFDVALENIHNQTMSMGQIVEAQLADALGALSTGDTQLAESVLAHDHRVNRMELAIDTDCVEVLARYQPAARDLRLLIALLRTVTDLERIGDECKDVARTALRLAEAPHRSVLVASVARMGRRVKAMLKKTLDALARLDPDSSLQLAHDDVAVDRNHDDILRQLVAFMTEEPSSVPAMMSLAGTVRTLERMGDHCRNVGEHVIFAVKAKDVRHAKPSIPA